MPEFAMTPRTSLFGSALLASAAALGWAVLPAPVAGPVFSHPLDITNVYAPFVPGATKSFEGTDQGASTAVTDEFTATTRNFPLNGGTVSARLLIENEYSDGELSEISHNWFAQADDGGVYYFGETVDVYEGGVVVDHPGSWLVGGPGPGDPPGTATATTPGLFMPADPQVGEQWKPEDLFPIVDETVTLLRRGVTVNVAAGEFEGCLLVKETSQLPGNKPEKKWYAPGVGVVKVKAQTEFLELVATTIQLPPDDP
jgi:hypothetical protein